MKQPLKINTPKILQDFIKLESSGGMVMILAAFAAILMANSFFAESYKNIISYPLPFGFGEASSMTVKSFVKDILMVLFFFIVGMELKKEIVQGFLSKINQVILPLIAAAGGMAVPAIIYSFLNADILATQHGWAIPSATDIAFALCVLTIFGRSVPPSIKIFLLAIAIFDDLGAILIIAFFYSSGVQTEYLVYSMIIIIAMYLLNRNGLTNVGAYIAGGIILLPLFEHAGIHTTVAGVITGLLIPFKDRKNPKNSPLNKLMHVLHPWVTFVVLPIFAFVSAGVSLVSFDASMLFSPITLGIILGLFIGKQIGIFGLTYLCVKGKLASLPEGSSWKDIYAVSILAGIGFTMSLFISQLAFTDPVFQEEAKLGILAGSFISAVLGAVILKWKGKK